MTGALAGTSATAPLAAAAAVTEPDDEGRIAIQFSRRLAGECMRLAAELPNARGLAVAALEAMLHQETHRGGGSGSVVWPRVGGGGAVGSVGVSRSATGSSSMPTTSDKMGGPEERNNLPWAGPGPSQFFVCVAFLCFISVFGPFGFLLFFFVFFLGICLCL